MGSRLTPRVESPRGSPIDSSTAQRTVLGVDHVYYFYNEDTSHHFHVWMVPRYSWMSDFGRSVESLRPALRHARETMSSPTDLRVLARASERLATALRA